MRLFLGVKYNMNLKNSSTVEILYISSLCHDASERLLLRADFYSGHSV